MIFFQKIDLKEMPTREDPLYVGHFFNLERMWWRKRRQRQEMIFSIALAWARMVKKHPGAPGMFSGELFLGSLTKQVGDARVILEHFFNITRLGFNFGEGNATSPTVVSPKKLPKKYFDSIDKFLNKVIYNPGTEPTQSSLVKTLVNLQPILFNTVKMKLIAEDREDLIPQIEWLLQQGRTVNFYYRPAGKLQARDTSVWPIRAVESWPSWLRTDIFGNSVDIENAFCQFLMTKLEEKHIHNKKHIEVLYPDLMKASYHKKEFREYICQELLQLPSSKDNINVVKKLMMSLSNGSNISSGILHSECRSDASQIIKAAAPHLTFEQTSFAGDKLRNIARQFRRAKRELCFSLFKQPPTRTNQKKIFAEYFKWEREARYKIWNIVGQSGLHLHDGIEGLIFNSNENLVDKIYNETRIRVTLD